MPTARLKDKAITVPDEVLDELELAEGDAFEVVIAGGLIVLKPHQEDCAERHPEIDAALEAALKEVEEGRVTPAFGSAEEFEAYRRTKAYQELLESE
ncbi:MAG: AbrB/MazE/SpoVT family DNA-binding domain-containing protein [Deinococcota bacterium]|jgi:antitoxin component of MazEF toxin-antitoxin module|nr:AbrB/MazE/SpoVT family DNA-binding domain-containing protein [Deinococcota bacterium]